MQVPAWFDQSYYMALKLAHVQAIDPSATLFTVEKAIADAGMTPYSHYQAFGVKENLSPNKFFNVNEYLQAKANQLNADGETTIYTAATVASAFEKAGVTPWQHYMMSGGAEGVNPSNAFDNDAYMTLKLNSLIASDPKTWEGKTVADLQKTFQDMGITPLDHYLTAGKTENLMVDESQIAAVNPVTPSPVKLPTHTLTDGIDTLRGADIDELFQGTDKTWAAGDTVDGGKGYDTLHLQQVNTITKGSQQISNVENLILDNVTGADIAADVSAFSGLEKVQVQGGKDVNLTLGASVKNAELSNITGTTVSVTGDGVTRLGLTNVTDRNAVVTVNNTTADHNLTLALADVGDYTGKNGVEIRDANAGSLTVVTNSDSAVDLVAGKAKTINLHGAGDLYIGNTLTGGVLESINAFGMFGDLTIGTSLGAGIAFTGGTGADTVTVDATTKQILTGKGNDTVHLGAAAVGVNGLLDGGDGRDTLGMSFANAAAVGTNFTNQVKNFEILHLGGNAAANAVIDFDTFKSNNAFDTVRVDASTEAFSLKNLADKSTVQLAGNMDQAVSLLVKDAGSVGHDTDTISLIMGGETTGANVKGLVLTDLEVVNITSQGGANTIQGLTGHSAKAIMNIKGDADLSLTTGDMGVSTTFDATSFKGKLTLDASANSAAMKITGGENDDILTGGLVGDVIAGGKGNDTFKSSAGADTLSGGEGKDTFAYSVLGHSTASSLDNITDFKHAEDKLDLSAVGGKAWASADLSAAQAAVQGLGAGATLTDALNAAASSVDVENGVVWFEFSGKTYVYQESATGGSAYNAGDLVVELAGTNLGLTTDDFTFTA